MADVMASWWLSWECDGCGATGDAGPFTFDEVYDGDDVDHECGGDDT